MASGDIVWSLTDPSDSILTMLRVLPDGTIFTSKPGLEGQPILSKTPSLGGVQTINGQTGTAMALGVQLDAGPNRVLQGGVEFLDVSADGKTVVYGDSGRGGIRVLDWPGSTVRTKFGEVYSFGGARWSLSTDGKWLAGTFRGFLCLWNVSARRPTDEIKADIKLPLPAGVETTALKFGASGTLAVGFADGRVQVWTSPLTADVPPTWETMPGRRIGALTFSADSATLYVGDERGDLEARDAQTGTLQRTLRLLLPSKEDGFPTWVTWEAAGNIQTGTP